MNALPRLSRRTLLLGATGGLLVAACGGGEDEPDEGADSSTSSTTPGEAGAAGHLVLLVPTAQPVGKELRIPFGLAAADGSFDVDLPPSVEFRLRAPDGATRAPVTVELHDQDLPRGYYPLRATLDVEGRWGVVVETGTAQLETTIDARPASELPAVPGPGDALPMIPTPLPGDPQGVDPICTAEPQCPFHDHALDRVIGAGNPIVLLVSTPAFCQVAICGPVLDLLAGRAADLEAAGVSVIHAEVYTDTTAKVTSPTIDALGLTYEPALFLAAPDGTVTDRLDAIFDGTELDQALAKLIP